MERIPCKECGVGILPTTAKATGGYCMPCADGETSGFDQVKEKEKSSTSRAEISSFEWVVGILGLIGVFFLFWFGKVLVAVFAAWIARQFFDATWNTVSMIGVFTYLGISLLEATADLPFFEKKRGEPRE